MTGPGPEVSVIIPTCGRPQSLARAVRALQRQQVAGRSLEVIVVVDGDDQRAEEAREVLRQAGGLPHPDALRQAGGLPHPGTFPGRVIALGRQRGAAAARNAGAEVASAPLLLFLDDDIEASAGLVNAHLAAHVGPVEGAPRAVIGYLATRVVGNGFFAIALRGWWEAMFEAMRAPGHRFGYRDLLTGNLSVPAATFRAVGGFDEALQCHEDYEFGARLVAAGVELRFCDQARGVHDERTDLDRALARKRDEGLADVQILQRHPRLLPTLPIGWFELHASRRQRWLREVVFHQPRFARVLARAIQSALGWLEGARLRGRWRRLLDDLLTVHYWAGVQQVMPDRRQVRALTSRQPAEASASRTDAMSVDLAATDWRQAQTVVNRRRPPALRVTWEGIVVGEIQEQPGAEGLRAAHLTRALTEELAEPLLRVLDASGVIQATVCPGGAVRTRDVPRASLAIPRRS